MKKVLLGFIALSCAHVTMAQLKTYDLYVVAEGNFGSPNGDVFRYSRTNDTTHTSSGALFQTANGTVGIDVLQDYGTFGTKAVLCSKGGSSSPYKMAIVSYPSFDTVKTFTGIGGIQCLGKASNTKGYASMATGNSIQLVDLANNTLTPVSDASALITSYASYMTQAHGSMYVAIGSKIVKIDTTTNATTTTILPNIGSIAGMQYDATNNCIWLLGKVSGTSALVKLQPDNNDSLNAPIILTGITNAAQLRLGANKLYFLSLKNVYTYNIAAPVIPTPLVYTSILAGNSFSFAYGKSFDVDPVTGDFAMATAGNYAQPTQFEIVNGTTFQQIDTGSVTGRIGNELELHTYNTPIPDTASLAHIYAQCSVVLDTPTAMIGSTSIQGTTLDSTTFNAQGNYSVTWKFTNGYTTVTAIQQVTVQDTIAPVPQLDSLPQLHVTCPYTLIPPTAMDNCAGNITGATDSLNFTTGGNYTIVWKYQDGHGNVSTQTQQLDVTCTTAIQELNQNYPSFAIYPNPASETITVDLKLSRVYKQLQLEITNVLGQNVFTEILHGNKNIISLNKLNSGVFYISLTSEGRSIGKVQKVIVNR